MSSALFRRSALPVLVSLALAGCSLAPKYERPALPVPDQYPGETSDNTAAGSVVTDSAQARTSSDLGWRQFFTDPRLQALIEVALANNRDMRIAVGRVQEARAQYGVVDADRMPTIGAGANAQITRNPENLRMNPEAGSVTRYYQAGIGLTAFELDFFGRLRNLSEAAFQQFLATAQARRTVHINLVAQVAEAYFRLRTAQQQKGLMQSTLQSRSNTMELVQAR